MCTDTLVIDHTDITHYLDGAKKRGEFYEVIAMPPPEILPDGTTFGYYSLKLPGGEKLSTYQYLKDHGGAINTETGHTRAWIRSLGKRIVKRAEYWNYRQARPPLFVKPAIIPDAVYVDIKAAFPSIYKILGWKTDYIRGKYWGVNDRLVYPFPMEWKAGRSFVVSGARHLQFGRYIKDGKVRVKKYMSPMSNPSLVAGVYDVLGMIARFSEYAIGARYWNVDGGIMSPDAARILSDFLNSIGLDARIKYEGRAEILSSGTWKIGKHETKLYKAGKPGRTHSGDFIGIDKDSAEWIYTHYRAIYEHSH